MGSHNENHPDRNLNRGLRIKKQRRSQTLLGMDTLEQRQLLAFAGSAAPTWHPTTQNPLDAQNGPLANAGPALIQVYQEYQNWQIAQNGKPIDLFSPSDTTLMTKSGLVGVQISVYGDTASMVNALSGSNVGMYVSSSNSHYGLIDGYVNPANLINLAQFKTTVNGQPAGVVSVKAMYKPLTAGSSTQGYQAMQVPAALQQYPGIDGTGVTIGILSDSINQFAGGLNDSVTAKAAPPLNRINVLQDGPAGSSDEGRGMLEVAYDVAPGANFAFHTAFIDDVNFAQGILDLSNAGCQVIVDDVSYATEPAFQVGPIENSVSTVVNTQNRSYFSSARNSADHGYMSSFRPVSATVGGTAGTWMNFDPNGGTTTQLPITVNAGGRVNFQFDQPWYTTNGVTSQVNVYFLDSTNKVVASGTANNIANQDTQQFVDLRTFAGQKLTMAVQLASGPAPAHIFAAEWGGSIQFSKQFGTAGGTSYPTSTAHNAPLDGIGVGAIDVRAIPPFSTATPIPSEDFSSNGPRILVYDNNGKPISGGAQVLQRPQISAPDGIQTTFFGQVLAGEKLPSFFGTSCAAPDAASLAALMVQLAPGSTQKDILTAMIDSTISINGKPAGTGNWDPVGGAGLIQAPKAFVDISQLTVTTTTPANGDTLTSLGQLQTVTVNFNKTVDPTTIKASDLVFSNLPTGVTVTSQSVLAAGSIAVFTVKVSRAPGAVANGPYTFTVGGKGSAIVGADGKPLKAPYSATFKVADTILPTILGTNISGRKVTIQFSEPMDPATVTPVNFKVLRGSNLNIDLSQYPGYTVTWYPTYQGLTNVAVIDLTALPQTALPSDHYAVEVLRAATDLVGNDLNGVYNGVFPTGDASGNPSDFLEDLGQITLQAPYVLTLTLDPSSDTGIAGDSNTNQTKPKFIGQVAAIAPQAIAGLKVVVQFNALHNNTLDLVKGPGGRGYVVGSSIDVQTTTDANGKFSFQTPANLPDGLLTVRVVVVGQTDVAGKDGLSSQFDKSIRVDTTNPIGSPIGVAQGAQINNLGAGISFSISDPVLPNTPSPIGIPVQYAVTALDPATATNISFYRLLNVGSLDGSSTATVDYSGYILSATYTDTTNRTTTTDPYTGRIDLKFAPGLPAGHYKLIAMGTDGSQIDITDAAGNPLDGDPNTPGAQNVVLTFDLQPTPSYITGYQAISPDADGNLTVVTGPKDYYEIPAAGQTPRAPAAPTRFYIDFSGPLNPNVDYSNRVQLIRSGDNGGASDGNFGTDPTFATGVGYTVVSGITVKLVNSIAGATYGQPGYLNRLQVDIKPGTTLPADYYRIIVPNTTVNGQDLRISDLYGNQIDGEFLGNPTSNGSYVDLMPNGQKRPGLTGDGVAGGTFETAFLVAPNGNVIFARADYSEDPYLPGTFADGSPDRPYPVLAPQALPNALNGGNLNSAANFGTGFNPNIDISGQGRFDLSAFYAASQLSKNGPVVVVALASNPGDPLHRTFVLRQPSQNPTLPTIPDGSASVPANTMLVMQPGSILKMYNASLFVQNQGAAIQLRGGPNASQQVVVTSYYDSSVGGNTANAGVGIVANAGDFGGILLRNFDDTSNGGRTIPIVPGPDDPNRPNLYGRTKLGVSGADEALSYFNFATMRYGGGAVPNTSGYRFDAITLYNTRPAITNTAIDGRQLVNGSVGPNGGSQAGISADMDSLREDPLARGLLVRQTTIQNTSINGIYVRAELNGVIEPTNALYLPNNPSNLGGAQNYTLDDPLPYVLTARMVLGQQLQQSNNLKESTFAPRLYVQPGMVVKFQRGSAIDITNASSTMNVGDRTYFNQWDQTPNFAPTDANFKPQQVGDARVIFTSFFDDAASSQYIDPTTGVKTQIVAPLDSDNGGSTLQPQPGNVDPLARWGGISIYAGARILIDEADLRYGGGTVNSSSGTIGQRDVLYFQAAPGKSVFGVTKGATGQKAYITNNSFTDNLQAPITIDANGLLAADPLRPFQSGNPFFRGNVMERNDINGVEVYGVPQNRNGTTNFGYASNLSVDSVWDDTDVTYVLQTTISLDGWGSQLSELGTLPTPPSTFGQQLTPYMSLTLQSNLPDTLLANGQRIGKPGESLLIKLLNDKTVMPVGDGVNGMPSGNVDSDTRGGAGFLVGFDDGVDGAADGGNLIDPGLMSQIRIVGIGGNETTGQQRVPVIITSARDNSVGRTVRGVTMNQAMSTSYLASAGYTGSTPAAGDGGVIGFGGLSLSDYNLYDPRDGNIIDNADIRFMTRIDIQGGGWAYSWGNVKDVLDRVDAGTLAGDKAGVFVSPDSSPAADPWFQYNTSKAMTISNSNLANFSQVGVIAHPSGVAQIHYQKHPADKVPALGRGSWMGESVTLFMVNNTLANMPTGVRINSETVDTTAQPSPYAAIIQNNTFFNTDTGIHTQAPNYNGQNSLSHVYFTALDNIFANNTTTGIQVAGQAYSSQALYNLFSNTPTPITVNTAEGVQGPFNAQPIFGNAGFTDPTTGDFTLTSLSDAIDAALSEIKQSNWGTYLKPIATQSLTGTLGNRNLVGRANVEIIGGLRNFSASGDIVTLPGLPTVTRGFVDQWVPVLPGTPGSSPGNTISAAYSYVPLAGERDSRGYLRIDDPNKGNVGFGSRPFFDIGAYEYRQLIGPEVTSVQATLAGPATNPVSPLTPNLTSIYVVNGIGGVNQSPTDIRIHVNQQLDPNTVNNLTVLLQASGGDGIFGNGNNSQDRFISLSGKISYDPGTLATATTPAIDPAIVVHLGDLGLNLSDDLYRFTVLGSGATVVANAQGLALDGENTTGNTADGAQQALPSGNGIPGGNFYVTFLVKTSAPTIVTGTFKMGPDADNYPTDPITNNNKPTFVGTIFDTPPPTNPLYGATVAIDISTKGYDASGNIVWDLMNAGTGTTDANGNFAVALSKTVPDTNYNVGPDGILGTSDDSGYSVARVRIISSSGNQSSLTDTNALYSFVVDTKGPQITGSDPVQNSKAQLQSGGIVSIAVAFPENIDPKSLTTSTLKAVRSGGDGIFGNGNDVTVSIDPASIQEQYQKTPAGAAIVRFNLTGIKINDVYQVTLLGTGTGVSDIAGNLIDGETPNGLPSGDGKPGGSYNLQFIVLDPSLVKTRYVDATQNNSTPTGLRANAYKTIGAAITAANIGDTVAVVGGSATSTYVTYTETVNLKSLVQVLSADPSSTDAKFVPGIALKTVIKPALTATNQVAVVANNLISLPDFPSRISGFSIINSYTGGSAYGALQPNSTGVYINNSDVLVDRNIITTSGQGVTIATSGLSYAPRLYSNVIVGNINGILIGDDGTTSGFKGTHSNIQIVNNTVAWNTHGVAVSTDAAGPVLADIANNIFWQNADRTITRNGAAITATNPNRLQVRYNLFSANGPSITSPTDDTYNVGGGFNPALLSSTKTDALGNYTGEPAFVAPLDPRPDGQGLGNFFQGANYDITARSAAIDNGTTSVITKTDGSLDTDFLFRGRVNIPNVGFNPAGLVDAGAYEYNGTNAKVAGMAQTGGNYGTGTINTMGLQFGSGISVLSTTTTSVTILFASAPDRATVKAEDLLLSGPALNPSNPAQAISVTWINSNTARFNLSSPLASNQQLQVDFAPGALRNANGTLVPNFSQSLSVANVVAPPTKPVVTPKPTVKHPVHPKVPKTPVVNRFTKNVGTPKKI